MRRPGRESHSGTNARPSRRALPLALACSLVCAALLAPFPAGLDAHAQLQRCDAKQGGKKTFSNVGAGAGASDCSVSYPNRGKASGKKSGSAKKRANAPARSGNYPKVTQSKQQERDQMRLQVLQDELQTEFSAATAYDEQIKTAQLTQEELEVMMKILNNHILNIQALQREIATIK